MWDEQITNLFYINNKLDAVCTALNVVSRKGRKSNKSSENERIQQFSLHLSSSVLLSSLHLLFNCDLWPSSDPSLMWLPAERQQQPGAADAAKINTHIHTHVCVPLMCEGACRPFINMPAFSPATSVNPRWRQQPRNNTLNNYITKRCFWLAVVHMNLILNTFFFIFCSIFSLCWCYVVSSRPVKPRPASWCQVAEHWATEPGSTNLCDNLQKVEAYLGSVQARCQREEGTWHHRLLQHHLSHVERGIDGVWVVPIRYQRGATAMSCPVFVSSRVISSSVIFMNRISWIALGARTHIASRHTHTHIKKTLSGWICLHPHSHYIIRASRGKTLLQKQTQWHTKDTFVFPHSRFPFQRLIHLN